MPSQRKLAMTPAFDGAPTSRRSRFCRARNTIGAFAACVTMGAALPATSHATDYYEGALGPDPLVTTFQDTVTTAPYGDRRSRWNTNTPHTTHTSYNLTYDFSIFEVNEIAAHQMSSVYFTRAHPGYFNGLYVTVTIRARSLYGGGSGFAVAGQALL